MAWATYQPPHDCASVGASNFSHIGVEDFSILTLLVSPHKSRRRCAREPYGRGDTQVGGAPLMHTLYYSPGACSLGPHIAIAESGLPYKLHRVAISEGANLKDDFLAINPRARVPALAIGPKIVTEGPAIMVYLATLRPECGLLPTAGSYELAKCLEWLAWLSSTLHISYAQYWRPRRFLPDGSDPQALIDQGRANIVAQSREIEDRLAGPWVIGDKYSVADCYLLAFYRWGARIGIPVENSFPRWTRWKDKMLDRPAVRHAIATEGIGTAWRPD